MSDLLLIRALALGFYRPGWGGQSKLRRFCVPQTDLFRRFARDSSPGPPVQGQP